VLVGVRCEVMVPSTDTPDQGVLSVSVEMTSLATPEYRPGKSFGVTSLIQQRLQDLLLGCGVVNLQDLCIAGGQGELGIRVYDTA
jgi:exosome complex component RRP43